MASSTAPLRHSVSGIRLAIRFMRRVAGVEAKRDSQTRPAEAISMRRLRGPVQSSAIGERWNVSTALPKNRLHDCRGSTSE